MTSLHNVRLLAGLLGLAVAGAAFAHPETAPTTESAQRTADGSRAVVAPAVAAEQTAILRLRLEDAATHQPAAGLVRVTPLADRAEPLRLGGLFERPAGWFSMPAEAELKVPPGRYRVEATRGTDTTVVSAIIDCTAPAAAQLTLAPVRFYDAKGSHLQAVNTHLHLLLRTRLKMGIDLASRAAADDYMRTVGASDGLDLVYVSYLTQPGLEVVSNAYTDADLASFSHGPVLFANGLEHRHGGKRITVAAEPGPPSADGKPTYKSDNSQAAMSYGHVMLLDLAKRSMLASLGPGLAEDPASTDGVPLRQGMIDAAKQGGGVIWCHGAQGLEWTPNWVAGLLHAQNIYDGGSTGTFDTVYYPFLNAGFKVPFSTGTDWGIWDFSRVYVSSAGNFTSKVFLRELAGGRSYITNEPFLEFRAGDAGLGDTLALSKAGQVRIRGRAVGRSDFLRLQLVCNGRVMKEVVSRPVDGHYEAEIDEPLAVEQSGWLALRIPPEQPYFIRALYAGPGTNVLGKTIFAHTSPIYVSVAGRPVADRAAIGQLITQIKSALATIDEVGVFANDAERAGIRRIYTEAEAQLRARLAAAAGN